MEIKIETPKVNGYSLLDLVTQCTGFSRTKCRTLIKQGAVELDNIKYTNPLAIIKWEPKNENCSN